MSEPSYIKLLANGELKRRAARLEEFLSECSICPWRCGANRLRETSKVCQAGYRAVVSAAAPHFGEEPGLSGAHLGAGAAKGTGNIFFGYCNLRCVYCQNWQISQELAWQPGLEKTPDELAQILLRLQAEGCHNLGFVSPTPWTPQIVRAIEIAAGQGLRLPLIYNTNAYDSVDVLRILEGVFDIYLPDLRYSDDSEALKYSHAPDYTRRSRLAVAEMFRQLGPELVVDEQGLVRRGLIIRLLILPNDLAGVRATLEWIREELSPRVTLSIMSQYYPTYKVTGESFPLLSRKIRRREYEQVLEWLDLYGFENGWIQPLEAGAPDYYRPDFSDPAAPFRDARDFLPHRDPAGSQIKS